jgi:AraC-like DNA-binding protein
LRIERVKELLITTNLQIAEIAKQAGFSGVEYLSAMFKKRVGLSPRAFRRKMGVR